MKKVYWNQVRSYWPHKLAKDINGKQFNINDWVKIQSVPSVGYQGFIGRDYQIIEKSGGKLDLYNKKYDGQLFQPAIEWYLQRSVKI